MTTPSPRSIGDRPLSLVTHLRATIDLLLDERTEYRWMNTARCNAGLLARVITGFTYEEMIEALGGQGRCWDSILSESCPYSMGTRWPRILEALAKAGVETSDVVHLEDLSHPDLLGTDLYVRYQNGLAQYVTPRRCADGTNQFSAYDDPIAVAGYLQRWIQAIEAYHAAVAAHHGATETPTIAITQPIQSHDHSYLTPRAPLLTGLFRSSPICAQR